MTVGINPIFEEFVKAAQPKRGLFVIPLPTGSGKTYHSCLLMAEELKKEHARQIVYVTDAKKQLEATVEEIRNHLRNNGVVLNKQELIRVYSQEEQWERAFKDPDLCMQMEATRFFAGDRAFMNLKRLYAYTATTEELADEIARNRIRLMDKICKEILAPIRQQYHKESDEVIASHILNAYPVLEVLYPELSFYRCKVMVLTAAKLHTTVSPKLVRKGTQPYWKRFVNTLVIVDESDRVKEAAMKRLFECECGRRRRFNFWGLCHFITQHYKDVLDLQYMPEWRAHKLNIQAMVAEIEQKKREYIDSMAPQKILSGIELKENVNQGNFIFYDEDQTFSAENVVLAVHSIPDENTSYLLSQQQSQDQCDLTLSVVANRIILFLKNFVQIVDRHAEAYASVENELRREKGTPISVDLEGELAFYHLLKYMGVNEGNTEYRLALQELRNGTIFQTSHVSLGNGWNDRSIYEKGVSFIEVYSRDNDRYSCSFDYHEMRCMPENVLLDLVKQNRVILCSATADIQTPIHNYDFNALIRRGVSVERMDSAALARIESYLEPNYAYPSLSFSLYSEEESAPEDTLKDYLGPCSEALKDCWDFIKDDSGKIDANKAARIVNMIRHYLNFLQNPEARAWLYFQPFSYTGKSGLGIKKTLNVLAQARKNKRDERLERPESGYRVGERYADIYPDLNVCFLSGDCFKEDLDAVEALLATETETKMFCFVCYQSGAVGVNYFYKVDGRYRKKRCLEAPNGALRKDKCCNFDGIILDKPTNFLSLLDVNDYLKACISLSVLGSDNQLLLPRKSAYQRDLLRRRHYRILDDFSEYLKKREIGIKADLKETPAYDAFCLRWAVQALGRVTRTTLFNKTIYVAMGLDMASALIRAKQPEVQTVLWKQVCDAIRKHPLMKGYLQALAADDFIRFQNEEHRRERFISSLVAISFKGTDRQSLAAREKIGAIREYVLRYPEFDCWEDISPDMRPFYVSMDEVKSRGFSCNDTCVHLDVWMRQRFLYDYFQQKGYSTSWKGKTWVLSPQIIQQVYIGYLGEQVFKALMENAGGTVTALPEKLWERADWLLNGQVYVDVKFMADSDFNRQVNAQAWAHKITACGGRYVIVNVPRYADGYAYSQTVKLENGARLPIVNGLIDLETGAVVDRNIQRIFQLMEGE